MGGLYAISSTDLSQQQQFRRVHQSFFRHSKKLFRVAGRKALGISGVMAKRLLLLSGRAFTRSIFFMAGWLGKGVLFALKAILRTALKALV